MTSSTFRSLVFLTLTIATGSAAAQSVEEFKQRSQQGGCQSIPYENHRNKCIQEQADAKDWCDGKGTMACGEVDSRALRETLRNLEAGIRSAESANKKDQVSELSGKKRQIEVTIGGYRKESERRAYANEKCMDFRKRVQQVFRDAESRASNDKNDSAKKESWSAIDTILNKIRSEYSGHDEQINIVQRRLEICRTTMNN